MPGQHRQQNRAQHVPLRGRVRARQMQRAARHKAVEQPQVIDALGCTSDRYSLASLRYDLSKLRAKDLVAKVP